MIIVALVNVFLVVAIHAKEGDLQTRSQLSTLTDAFKKIAELEQRMSEYDKKRITVLRGRDGRDGLPGRPGRDGMNGKDGTPGHRGLTGAQGTRGKEGPRGPPGPKTGGVKYTRWGKTSCRSGADLVYKGRIGGEHYTHTGGGADYVCMTESPRYGNYKPGHQSAAYMYGTEYELSFNPFTKSDLHDHEAPCVVCHVTTQNTELMIPGTYECPLGWTREYHGYLMSEFHAHAHPSKFICVDQDAEAVKGTSPNLNGALLYPVEGKCGALPCHPYVSNRELTCAVCTK